MSTALPKPPTEECILCDTATLWRDPRGFVVCDQVPRAVQTAATASEIMARGAELLNGELPGLVVLTNESRTDRGARSAFAEHGGQFGCVALVVQSKVSEVTGNFFMRINQPPYPMRLFGDVDEAIAWVLEFRESR